MLPDEVDRALSLVRERLEPAGSQISAKIDGAAFRIALRHDLTTPLKLHFSGEGKSETPLGFVQTFLTHTEIEVIARAPREMPHRALVGAIRHAAAGGHWPPHLPAQVARLLNNHGLLTRDEASGSKRPGRPGDPTGATLDLEEVQRRPVLARCPV